MLNPIPPEEEKVLFPLHGKTMLELGNKQTRGVSYKSVLTNLGIDHTSVDWNGLDGALSLDLREPLDLGQFDMVTNFGTTEHVSEQRPVWENVHNACKVGGISCGATPLPGDWPGHGMHYPTMEFYEEFARLNGYEITILEIWRDAPKRNIYYRMERVEEKPYTHPKPSLMKSR